MPRLSLYVSGLTVRRAIRRPVTLPKQLSLAESCTGVEPIVYDSQPRLEHVRVDLRGRQVGMTEHQLNRPKVRSSLEQVRGKGVTDDMRAERAADSRSAPMRFEYLPESDAGHRP